MTLSMTRCFAPRRVALACVLLLGGVAAARADNDIYADMTRHGRGDDLLHIDSQACRDHLGAPISGAPTARAYKACMRSHGWRFMRTEVEKTWTDPETGLTCHDILGGLGSSCSNF